MYVCYVRIDYSKDCGETQVKSRGALRREAEKCKKMTMQKKRYTFAQKCDIIFYGMA